MYPKIKCAHVLYLSLSLCHAKPTFRKCFGISRALKAYHPYTMHVYGGQIPQQSHTRKTAYATMFGMLMQAARSNDNDTIQETHKNTIPAGVEKRVCMCHVHMCLACGTRSTFTEYFIASAQLSPRTGHTQSPSHSLTLSLSIYLSLSLLSISGYVSLGAAVGGHASLDAVAW